MRKKKPVALDALLKRAPKRLQQLFSHAKSLQSLQQILAKVLEPELAPHCQALHFSKGTLHLELDSPVWQWRLNMQRTQIIEKLRQQGLAQLISITSKVQPKSSTGATPDSGFEVNRVMSHKTAGELRELAERMPEPLKSKLLKLADREDG